MNVKPMDKYQHLSLAIENKAVLNLSIMSTHFNKFFTQITSKIDKKTGKGVKKLPDYLHHKWNSFFLIPTCKNDVKDIVHKMQTDEACGPKHSNKYT